MGVLSRVERGLGNAVEGGFAKIFRSRVEPVELAVALKRECDEKKSVGPVQTMVPNDFVVDLGAADYDRLAPYILTLGDELAEMVLEHGSEQRYTFLGPVAVAFHRDDALTTGTYRIGSRVEVGDEAPVRPAPKPAPAARVYEPPPPSQRPPAPARDDVELTTALPRVERSAPRPAGTLVLPDGGEVTLSHDGAVVGRGVDADVRLADASVSRKHAAFSVHGDRVTVEDLGSTNGTTVNGERIVSADLADGDRVTLGAATIVFRA